MAARPPSDAFRPCLPFDPFTGVESGPWRPSISPHADPPSAILILGEPTPADLHPILYSRSLAQSLVIVATHAPPYIPQTPVAAVRILRLAAPLVQDTGALRLVGLLERADRAVRRYRADGAESLRKLVQLAEDSITGEFVVEEAYSPAEPPSPTRMRMGEEIPRYPSPAPSATSSLASSASSGNSSFSTTSSFSRRRRARVAGSGSNSRPSADRAFDAIINFLPSSLPDKLLLKHAILVSTLSASFITAPPAPFPSASSKSKQRFSTNFSTLSFSSADAHTTDPAKIRDGGKNSRRFSTLLRRAPPAKNTPAFAHSAPCSRDELPLLACIKGKSRSELHLNALNRKPHLVHILPSHVYNYHALGASGSSGKPHQQRPKSKPKPKLVQGIEQFLLAFGYPLQSMSLLPPAPPSAPGSPSESRSRLSSFMSAPGSFGAGIGTDAAGEKPIPFLLAAGVFGSVPTGGSLSIGEILLMSGLDGSGSGSGMSLGNEVGGEGMAMEESRVWIGSPEDVVWGDDPGSLSINQMRDYPREVEFAAAALSPSLRDSTRIHDIPHVPLPTHPHPRPTRSSSSPISVPHTTPSLSSQSSIKSPPFAHLAPSKPTSGRTSTSPSLRSSSSPLSSSSSSKPILTPVPATSPLTRPSNGRLHKSDPTTKRASMVPVIPKEVKQKQLPTPPESAASSLEDGDGHEDDRMTSETGVTMSTSVRGASTTDYHHLSMYQHQQDLSSQEKGKGQHYVKASSTIGHGYGAKAGTGVEGGGKKGFMARFGFGKLKALKVGRD
ncbi:hypothetical protein D9756_006554 [Leucocoprinus leucothites]|uniref:Uncharacterized protein n=1 Tax=Leucocoprinus leucothites TaxID=201217 RepID=A0A8H5G2K5_9AGAR|nr:hypothetical protein D9756_006554 [Leucoagaricus leucothites]